VTDGGGDYVMDLMVVMMMMMMMILFERPSRRSTSMADCGQDKGQDRGQDKGQDERTWATLVRGTACGNSEMAAVLFATF
jgi:hypothetical protein